MKDFLIVRPNCDCTTKNIDYLVDGLKDFLNKRGFSAQELIGKESSPQNIVNHLNCNNMHIKRGIIIISHGSCSSISGTSEQFENCIEAITLKNVELCQNLHVFAIACCTSRVYGLGQIAILNGCNSFLRRFT